MATCYYCVRPSHIFSVDSSNWAILCSKKIFDFITAILLSRLFYTLAMQLHFLNLSILWF